MTAIFSKTDPAFEALIGLMCAAKLTGADVHAAMLDLAVAHDRSGCAWAKLASSDRPDFEDVAGAIGWSPDEFMKRLVVAMYHRHATPENGCSILTRAVPK